MACDILPESIVQATGAQSAGKTVNPRGVWNPRFFGLPQCVNLPMIGRIKDRDWSAVEDNIRLGDPAVQNAWPGLTTQPYTGPPPVPAGGAGPAIEVRAVNQPNSWSTTVLPDAGLQMNLFVDDCVLESVYGANNPWSVGGPFQPGNDGCTYAYVTMAPMGTTTTTGRGGAQVLNACPNFVAEVSGVASTPPFFIPGWRSCTYSIPTNAPPPLPGSVTYNLCPPANPATGYTGCAGTGTATTIGSTRMIRAVDLVANSFTWMRGQQFRTQVQYLIPNINNPTQHLYVASQIETKQVL